MSRFRLWFVAANLALLRCNELSGLSGSLGLIDATSNASGAGVCARLGAEFSRPSRTAIAQQRFLAELCDTNSVPPTTYGNPKTYNAWPLCGILISGAIAAGTLRGLPPPSPVITAMYCLPSTLNVTGKPCTDVPSRVSHNIWPVLTSRTWTPRLISPTSTQPPAVDSAAVRNGACCSYFQASFMVFT